MGGEGRVIDLDVEVVGSVEAVWRAVATGSGISSWYVPHTVEERQGGAAMASFGPGPEMQVAGRVAVWEPPHRICFDGGEGVDGMAFEWTVQAQGDEKCLVRLVNTGFGEGQEWDSQYEAMTEGWRMFMLNLKLHLQYFGGQTATSALPVAMWEGSRDEAWAALAGALGISAAPEIGEKIAISTAGAPELSGMVVDVTPWRVTLLVDPPAPGTAFIAAEDYGGYIGVSVWLYLYGADGAEAAERDQPLWQHWLDERVPSHGGG